MSLQLRLFGGQSDKTELAASNDGSHAIDKSKVLASTDTSGWTKDGSFPVCDFTRPNSSFLDWVDFGQLVALVLASAGLFVLAMSMWRQINPLNLFPPVKVNIQIGTK